MQMLESAVATKMKISPKPKMRSGALAALKCGPATTRMTVGPQTMMAAALNVPPIVKYRRAECTEPSSCSRSAWTIEGRNVRVRIDGRTMKTETMEYAAP